MEFGTHTRSGLQSQNEPMSDSGTPGDSVVTPGPDRNGPTWTAAQAMGRGALGFGAVTMGVYASVAFGERWLYQTLTLPGAYALWTVMFLAGAPWVLGRLLVAPARRARFGWAFVLGFLAYAAAWTAAYFTVKRAPGEWLASGVGPLAMALVWVPMLGRWWHLLPVAAMLVVSHTVGYFTGSWLHGTLGGALGMLGWGVAHGLGFGAGMGWVIAGMEHRGERGGSG